MSANNMNISVEQHKQVYSTNGSGSNAPVSSPNDASLIGASGVTAMHDTTVFVDDNVVTKMDESQMTSIPRAITSINDSQDTQQQLKDFLAKPIILAQSTFSTSDTYSFLNSYSMPYAAFSTSEGAMWANKLLGIYGIRMSMRFRLVINANRFQQGRYCIGWTPLAGMSKTTSGLKELIINNMHNATLVQRTTCPHVEIDLCTGTSAELKVPFVSVQNFWPVQNIQTSINNNTLGFVNVWPYKPMEAPTGNTVANYTLYVSFEDIELFGVASPQGGISDREVSVKVNGPISGVASAFSRGFKEFSHIPLLGTYAKSVSWIADRISITAGLFGFSKPTQGDAAMKMVIVNAPSHANVDGDSDAKAIGLLSKPGVVTLEGFAGTNYDEMDFSFVLRRYAWLSSVSWTTSNNAGDLLAAYSIGPLDAYVVASTSNYTPFHYVRSFFSLWRGSTKYRIKIVKTEFHSGRISISYHPTNSFTNPTNDQYVNRVILDIREKNTVEIIVPYIAYTQWSPVGALIGKLVFRVVDPLVAPSTVTQGVTLLVEIAGGDDYEVAIPTSNLKYPTTITPQSGLEDETEIYSSVLGNAGVSSEPLVATSTSIGEKITSFRTLLHKYSPLAVGSTYTGTDQRVCTVFVDAIAAYISPAEDADAFKVPDLYSQVACCYATVRGGMRIRDTISMGLYQPATVPLSYGNQGSITTSLTIGAPTNLANFLYGSSTIDGSPNQQKQTQQLSLNNTVSVEVPQYSNAYGKPKGDLILYQTGTPGVTTTYNGYFSQAAQVNFILPKGVSNAYVAGTGYHLHNIFRSVADDFSCHTFISVPPMTTRAVAVDSGFF